MKYKLFIDLDFHAHEIHTNGIKAEMYFPNGYGISVIKSPYSYGGDAGLFEAAVLHKITRNGKEVDAVCTDTPITDDVKGWLTKDDVSDMMLEIQFLPKRK